MDKKYLFLVAVGVIIVILSVISYMNKNYMAEPSVDLSDSMNLLSFGVVGDGITDDTVNFQRALDEVTRKNLTLYVPAKTYLVSPLKYRDPSSTDWWCLAIPSHAKIYFETGAKLKLVEDAPKTTRVLVISEVTDVSIFGHIEVDGSASTITNGNEQMHGIFIYDSKDIYIESLHSYNSYGDNLFIGGTEENYSQNIKIKQFKGVKAGRKNLVIHYVDQLHIETAILDNSQGNVLNNWKGGNSLDLEPDHFQGKNKFYQRIDYLTTYGMGNDFTIGTQKSLAEKWVLEIGEFHVMLMDGATEGVLSYAVTVHIDRLLIKSQDGNQDIGISLMYGAIWTINEAILIDGENYAISAKSSKGEKPSLKINNLFISRPNGKGIELWGTDADIKMLEANTVKDTVLDILATNKQSVSIKEMISINSGESELIFISDYGYKPLVTIDKLKVIDNRLKKVGSIVNLNTQYSVEGFEVNELMNYEWVKEKTFGNTVNTKDGM